MSLAEVSIKRPIFITSLVSMMLILGFVSLMKMSVDLFPDVTFPIVSIQSIYPGASPLDVERQVSKLLEDELSSMGGLNKITSSNLESVSLVLMEFKIGTDIKDVEQQIRQRIGNIRRNFPLEMKDPLIRRFDPADAPILRLAVSSEISPAKVYDIVDEVVKPQFETLQGVGQVSIVGGRKREIHVLVDKKKLQERNISLLQVSDKIKNTSKDVPVGKIENNINETVLRASGEFSDLKSLSEVNVNFIGSDRAVALSQIAEVKEGLEDSVTIASLMTRESGFKKSPTVFVDVYKQSGANTVKVVDSINDKIDSVNQLLKTRNINMSVTRVRDNARPIRLNITDVRESITIGILLTIVVVFFFLGSFRSTFITGMALPNSLLGAFVVMYFMGFTINMMTLLALSLAVGLLIDDAIVVRENIFRHLEMGKKPRLAALEGTSEVALAVIATTLVVIAVFGPIAFLDGIVGQFFRQFGLTVVFAMLISLFDAFTMAPMLSAYMATGNEHKRGTGPIDKMLIAFDQMQTNLEEKYEKTIRWVLANPKKTLGGATFVFFLSLGLIQFIPKNFLPPQDNGEFFVKLEKPVGSSLESTRVSSEKLEELLKKNSNIELISTVVGGTDALPEATKANIYIRLVPSKMRKLKTSAVKDEVRELMKPLLTEGKISIADVDIVNSGQKPLNLNITGDNLDELAVYVDKLKAKLEKIPGFADVDTNYRSGKPEFHIDFDRAKSENLGVSTVTAGAELRARVEGVVPGTYRQEGREYDIRVRLQESDRDIRKEFASTQVPNANFNMIPLSKVAVAKETLGYSQVNRQSKSRFINLDGNLGTGGNMGSITSEIERIIKEDPEFKPPAGVSYRFQGQAEDFKDLMKNMMIAMLLGVVFIYLVLSSLYESFITPLTILLALPLAIVGAFLALFITQKSIDIFSLIGLVMLLGVVAKNSILLVDYTQHMLAAGKSRSEAIIAACKTRLRPILMTSFALIAGTLPIALGLNEASAQRTSMGVAIIGGLISSTALTLVVVPAAYGYVDDFRLMLGRFFSKLQGRSEK